MRFEWPADLGLAVPLLLSLLSLRLFRLAARTRELPELLVGSYFLLVPFGISLAIRVERFPPEHAAAVRAAANALATAGGVALLLFTWCVFRRAERWALWLAASGSATLATLWGLGFVLGAYDSSGSSFFLLLPTYASYAWVFAESLRYYLLLRRRQLLGLADPVLVNRFLLFAVWTGSVVVITLLAVMGSTAQWLGGSFHEGGALSDPLVLGTARLLALPIAVSLWLIFLAPASYHAWLRHRAASAAG